MWKNKTDRKRNKEGNETVNQREREGERNRGRWLINFQN